MHRLKVFFCLLVTVFTAPLWGQSELADIYLNHAIERFNHGRVVEALNFATIGLEYDAESTDLHTLVGILSTRTAPVAMATAREHFEQAEALGRWNKLGQADWAVWYAKTLLRMGEAAEAVEVLSRIQAPLDNVIFWGLKAQALCESGNLPQGLALLETLLLRSPNDTFLLSLQFRYRGVFSVRDFEALKRAWKTAHSTELYLSYLRRKAQPSEAAYILDELWGEMPRTAEYWYYTLLSRPESLEAADHFINERCYLDLELTRSLLTSTSISETLKKRIADSLSSGSDSFRVDRNRDGYYEEYVDVVLGRVAAWHWDTDQDEIREMTVEFSGGIPVRAVFRKPKSETILEYEQYPLLRSLTIKTGGTEQELFFSRNQASFILHTSAIPEDEVLLLNGVKTLPQADLNWVKKLKGIVRAVQRVSIRPDEQTIYLFGSDGALERVERTWRGTVMHQIKLARSGSAVGLRDIDRDGVFDLEETYENGKLLRVRFLAKSSENAPGLTYLLNEEVQKRWDFNRDGVVDRMEVERLSGETSGRELYRMLTEAFSATLPLTGEVFLHASQP